MTLYIKTIISIKNSMAKNFDKLKEMTTKFLIDSYKSRNLIGDLYILEVMAELLSLRKKYPDYVTKENYIENNLNDLENEIKVFFKKYNKQKLNAEYCLKNIPLILNKLLNINKKPEIKETEIVKESCMEKIQNISEKIVKDEIDFLIDSIESKLDDKYIEKEF